MLHINKYPVFPDGFRKKQSGGFGPLSGTLVSSYNGTFTATPSSLEADPDYGVPRFLWCNGDGNNPRIVPDPALVFALTGVMSDGITPLQYQDGTDELTESHSGASYRRTLAYSLEPADPVADDMVIAVKGMILTTLAPAGWSGELPAATRVLTRATTNADLLNATSVAPGNWARSDGVTQIVAGTPASGVYVSVWSAWQLALQYIQEGLVGPAVTAPYDGTVGGTGLLQATADDSAGLWVRSVEVRSV